jgi:ribose transport system permease protein
MVYTVCGFLTGIAGLIMLARISSGQPNAGTGFEMDMLAAVVLGGVSVAGARAQYPGSLSAFLSSASSVTGFQLWGLTIIISMLSKG